MYFAALVCGQNSYERDGFVKRLVFLLVLCMFMSLGAATSLASDTLDVLRVGVATLPNNLDPATGVAVNNSVIYPNIFDTVILADPYDNYKMGSDICEAYQRIDDYTVEFKLKDGIIFQDGSPLTADDVKFSIDRIIHDTEGYSSPNIKNIIPNIEDVQVIDSKTFRIITSIPDPVILSRLASTLGVYIVPKAYVEKVGKEEFGKQPIGTGPYMVESYSPEKVVLKRFEGFWGEAPVADRIEYIAYPELSTRVAALLSGEIDIAFGLTPDMADVVEADGNFWVEATEVTSFGILILNTTNPPMSDKTFRQALSMAIDRQLICDTIWQGYATVPNGYNFTEYGDLYVEDYPTYEYNLEKAKELLAKSSYNGEPITYKLMNNYYTNGNEIAEAVVAMWRELGVDARVVLEERWSWDFEYAHNWSNGIRFTDPLGGLWLLWGADTAFPTRDWMDMPQEFIDLGRELEVTMDQARKYEINRRMMEIWDEEVPGTILYKAQELHGVRNGLKWQRASDFSASFRAGVLSLD